MAGIYTDMRLAPHALKTGLSDAQGEHVWRMYLWFKSVFDMTNEAADKFKI